jgi:hypothetical protein
VPWSLISNIGGVIQGSGNDILDLRTSGSTTVTRITEDGTLMHSGAGGVVVNGVAGATGGARFAGGTTSGAPASGTWKAGDFVIDQTGKVWIYTGSAWVASGGSSATGLTLDNASLPLADAIGATPGKSAKTAPADHRHPRISWAAADHGLVTWTMDVMVATASSVLPAAGTLYVWRGQPRRGRLLHRAVCERDDAAGLRPRQRPVRRAAQRGPARQLPGRLGEHRRRREPAGHAHRGQHRLVACLVLRAARESVKRQRQGPVPFAGSAPAHAQSPGPGDVAAMAGGAWWSGRCLSSPMPLPRERGWRPRKEQTRMRRITFDTIASAIGLLLAVLLLVAGGLLYWAYDFTNTQVQQQLSAQQITFPAADSPALKALPPDDAAAMKVYAGQLMTTGAQAKTYADHYIAVHLSEVAGGKTYAQVSAQSLAHPNSAVLKAQADTLFKGNTLRGLLLNAYAFWQVGQIALIAAIVAWVAGAIMLVLVALGFWHRSRTPADSELRA